MRDRQAWIAEAETGAGTAGLARKCTWAQAAGARPGPAAAAAAAPARKHLLPSPGRRQPRLQLLPAAPAAPLPAAAGPPHPQLPPPPAPPLPVPAGVPALPLPHLPAAPAPLSAPRAAHSAVPRHSRSPPSENKIRRFARFVQPARFARWCPKTCMPAAVYVKTKRAHTPNSLAARTKQPPCTVRSPPVRKLASWRGRRRQLPTAPPPGVAPTAGPLPPARQQPVAAARDVIQPKRWPASPCPTNVLRRSISTVWQHLCEASPIMHAIQPCSPPTSPPQPTCSSSLSCSFSAAAAARRASRLDACTWQACRVASQGVLSGEPAAVKRGYVQVNTVMGWSTHASELTPSPAAVP